MQNLILNVFQSCGQIVLGSVSLESFIHRVYVTALSYICKKWQTFKNDDSLISNVTANQNASDKPTRIKLVTKDTPHQ